MTTMIKVLIQTKGKSFKEKVMAITEKCLELKDSFPCFSWEFQTLGGKTCFTASWWNGEEGDRFQFPILSVEVGEKYKEIRRELDELKWSALLYERGEKE